TCPANRPAGRLAFAGSFLRNSKAPLIPRKRGKEKPSALASPACGGSCRRLKGVARKLVRAIRDGVTPLPPRPPPPQSGGRKSGVLLLPPAAGRGLAARG